MIADMMFEEHATGYDYDLKEEIYEEEIIDQNGQRKVIVKTRIVKQRKNDVLIKISESNNLHGNPLDSVMGKLIISKKDPDLEGAKDVYEELLDDGSKVKVIVKADGTIIKKIITQEEMRENEQQMLFELRTKTISEVYKIKDLETEINTDKAELLALEQKLQCLNQTEKFKPPGIKGKILKRIVNDEGE